MLTGTLLGTAFHLWATHRRGDARAIARAARATVLADWLFTATSGLAQPETGVALLAGYDLRSSWLVAPYVLYAIAGVCWLKVVQLQLRIARIAATCLKEDAALPPAYFQAMRAWFVLGWPAFLGLIVVVWLMVAKPVLW